MATPVTSRPTPVFVLGLQRSGTTWLANVISQHSRVAAVQSHDHFGILSSIFFSHFVPAYGDLNDESNFRRFATDFASSDYYLVSGLDPSWLSSIKSRSYPEIFRAMMDEVAGRQGADLWLEKSPVHTPIADELADAFPDARFICIVRKAHAATASQLWLHGGPQSRRARVQTLLSLSLHRAQQRLLRNFCQRRKDRCFFIHYEGFVADTEGVTRRACEFLGIEFEPTMLDLPWRRNTSFNSVDRRHALGLSDRAIVAAVRAVLSLVPLPALRSLLAWRRTDQIARQGRIVFPDWTWLRRDSELANSLRNREELEPLDVDSDSQTRAGGSRPSGR